VPEVVEFYHSLMRRESKRDGGSGGDPANGGGAAATRDMIGEIENRSAHLLAVRTVFFSSESHNCIKAKLSCKPWSDQRRGFQ
jgi:Wiskott-Aldrich syndrome protein